MGWMACATRRLLTANFATKPALRLELKEKWGIKILASRQSIKTVRLGAAAALFCARERAVKPTVNINAGNHARA